MNIIFNKIEENYKRKKPFVAYRKPNSNTISGFLMNNDELCYTSDFTESGFVFAPFKSEEKTVVFPIDKSEYLEEELLLDKGFLLKNL